MRYVIVLLVGAIFLSACARHDPDTPEQVVSKIKSGEVKSEDVRTPPTRAQEMAELECQQMAAQIAPRGGPYVRYGYFVRCMQAKGY